MKSRWFLYTFYIFSSHLGKIFWYFATRIFLYDYITTLRENRSLLSLPLRNASMVILLCTVWSDLIMTSRNSTKYVVCIRLYIVNTVTNLCQTESFSLNWKLSVVFKVFYPCLTKIWNIQGDSEGICTTLGNDSMSDSKQKSSYEHGSDFERLRSYGHFLIPVHTLVW